MKAPTILAFAGSTRSGSFNQQLLNVAAEGAREVGVEVIPLNLGDFSMPLFNQDLEEKEGPPDNVRKLKSLFLQAQGLLIASPEYNSSITPLLKNVIDWLSREEPNLAMLAAFKEKQAALISASPSGYGGVRSVAHLKALLENIGVDVIDATFSLPKAYEAFSEDGKLKDETSSTKAKEVGMALARKLMA